MGRHQKGQVLPRETRPTRPQPVYPSHPHKKKAGWLRWTIRVIVVLFLLLLIMSVIGNFLPSTPKAKAVQPPRSEQPLMGYNTWYQFGDNISETAILNQANLLVQTGLASSGYDIMTIDDSWQAASRSGGKLTWNTAKFPHGMPWLAAQLHGMGLKFGIYTAIGANTCTMHGALPGSFGHYATDAATFKSWGVDFVKVDSCKGLPPGTTNAQLTSYFQQFGGYIHAQGMYYSQELPVLMPPGSNDYYSAVNASSSFADMWRVTADEHYVHSAQFTIIGHLMQDLPLYHYAHWGHWNDLDMIVPGKPDAHPFNWTLAQEQSQVAVWAMEASPLFISSDIGTLSGAEIAMLKNPHIVNIDASGAQAPYWVSAGHITAVTKGADGGVAVLLANTGTGTASGFFTLPQAHVNKTSASAYNVWTGKTAPHITGIRVTLPPGGTALYVMK